MNRFDILIVGGHHSSAVPIIKKLQNTHKIKFIGHKYASVLNSEISSEYKEITSLEVDYINLKAPKFYKVGGFSKYFKLFKSTFFCLSFLIKNRPKLVLSFGGYLAVPVCIAAKILFIPIVTHEQTLEKGMANKVVSKLSTKVLLSWPTSNLSKKYVVVGLPLREEIKNVPTKKIGKDYKIKTIFIQGGKQGSHVLNRFVFENIEYLVKKYKVIHQTSKHSENNDFETSKKLSSKYKGNYQSFDFIFGKDYTKVLTEADMIISRSGAHMTYEACFIKMPSVFVPIPWVSGNEQFKLAINANNYIPSVVLQEKDLNFKSLKSSFANLKTEVSKAKKYNNVIEDSDERVMQILLQFLN